MLHADMQCNLAEMLQSIEGQACRKAQQWPHRAAHKMCSKRSHDSLARKKGTVGIEPQSQSHQMMAQPSLQGKRHTSLQYLQIHIELVIVTMQPWTACSDEHAIHKLAALYPDWRG